MFIIIWQYTINPNFRDVFIEHYKADGVWANFFQQSPHYFGTDFFETDDNQFVTVDKWQAEVYYERFLENYRKEYKEIDDRCEQFTVAEELAGKYIQL
jgi:hypothetical protein